MKSNGAEGSLCAVVFHLCLTFHNVRHRGVPFEKHKTSVFQRRSLYPYLIVWRFPSFHPFSPTIRRAQVFIQPHSSLGLLFIFQRPQLFRSSEFYLALSSLLKYRAKSTKIIVSSTSFNVIHHAEISAFTCTSVLLSRLSYPTSFRYSSSRSRFFEQLFLQSFV